MGTLRSSHVLLGSTSGRVVRHAPRQVLVARRKEHNLRAQLDRPNPLSAGNSNIRTLTSNKERARIMATVAKLIERHIATQRLKDNLKDAAPQAGSCLVGDISYGPCLLVSREYGCGGGVIARRVAESLGWNVFDREIVDKIAQIGHFRQRLVESVDERVRTYWERTWRELLTDDNLGDDKYLRYLRQLVLSLGHHGRVVIVGRGAQFILPPACALRVRVVAPLEIRIAEVSERENLSADQAKVKIHQFDAARRNFVWSVFNRLADSNIIHDLVINTGEISIHGVSEIVLAALREKLGVCPQAVQGAGQ